MTNTQTAGITNYRNMRAQSRVVASDVLEACYAALDWGIHDDLTPGGRAVGGVMAALLSLPREGVADEVQAIVDADRDGTL